MFTPLPPGNDDDRTRISETLLAPLPAPYRDSAEHEEHALPANVPQGNDLHLYVLNCLDNRSSCKEVRQQLIAFGYTADEAEQVVADVEWRRLNSHTQAPTHTASGADRTRMIMGGIVCLIGLAVSIAASSGGGSYVVAWFPIVWGAFQFFRGLSQSNQS